MKSSNSPKRTVPENKLIVGVSKATKIPYKIGDEISW